jgi:hypothetical protein
MILELQIVLKKGVYKMVEFEPLYFNIYGYTTIFTFMNDRIRIVVDEKNEIEFNCYETFYTMVIK